MVDPGSIACLICTQYEPNVIHFHTTNISVHTQPQRPQHRTLPNPRRQIRPHRKIRRPNQNGGGRNLRHRNIGNHRTGIHRRRLGMFTLHEKLRLSPRAVEDPTRVKAAGVHQQDLRYSGVVSPMARTGGGRILSGEWQKRDVG